MDKSFTFITFMFIGFGLTANVLGVIKVDLTLCALGLLLSGVGSIITTIRYYSKER